jgi:hypothetical protein
MKVLVGTKDKDLRRIDYPADYRAFVRYLALPILKREKQRVYIPSEFALGASGRRVKIGVVQIVSDHHEINITVGSISPLRNRSEEERSLDRVGVWFEAFSDWLGHANGFLNESSQLVEDRSSLVCAVILLIADALDGYQSAPLQLR